jgi:hypothetical protein
MPEKRISCLDSVKRPADRGWEEMKLTKPVQSEEPQTVAARKWLIPWRAYRSVCMVNYQRVATARHSKMTLDKADGVGLITDWNFRKYRSNYFAQTRDCWVKLGGGVQRSRGLPDDYYRHSLKPRYPCHTHASRETNSGPCFIRPSHP